MGPYGDWNFITSQYYAILFQANFLLEFGRNLKLIEKTFKLKLIIAA